MRPSFNGRTSDFESDNLSSSLRGRSTYRPLSSDEDLELLFPHFAFADCPQVCCAFSGECCGCCLTDKEREAFLEWWRD